MVLKGLHIQGFKSFADKISLDFSNGVTAIVGPNGSGKSNISDAVRWVLGEQSAKSLRGSKMEDVIFNGTQKRKPLGFAEVTLILDNKDKRFHIDFDEVAVTRKVFASGESQYFINKASCRLKDIHEIFMDTGLGRDGYSMVGQGKIEEILSTKSEDRRQIFEEAAGISKYRYRKEEAERKLTKTEENLDRVSDIILELETQLEPLARQSEKAKKYLTYKEELKIYEVNMAIAIIENNRVQLDDLEKKFQIVSDQLDGAKADMERAEREQEEFYNTARGKEEAVRVNEQELRGTEASISMRKGEIEVLRNTINGNLQLIERIKNETADLKSRILDVNSEITRAEESKAELLETCGGIDGEIEELNRQGEALLSGAGEQNEQIEKLKEIVVAGLDRVSNYKIKLSNFDIVKQNILQRQEKISAELGEKTDALSSGTEKLEQFEKERARKQQLIASIEGKLSEEKDQQAGLSRKLEADRQETAQLSVSIGEKRSRLQVLKAMEQNFEGYAKSVREVMKQHRGGALKGTAIHGPVSKLVSTEEKYRTAVEVTLGGALQNIVVDSEEDAKAAIAYLKASKSGRATFMPISAVRGTVMDTSKLAHERGFLAVASELAQYDGRYAGIVRNLLGRTVVVDNVDNGIAMSRKYKNSFRIVTLEGELFNVGGSMSGGAQLRHANIMGREQDIASLEKEIAALQRQQARLKETAEEMEVTLAELSGNIRKGEAALAENREVLLILNQDITYSGGMAERLRQERGTLEQENTALEEQLAAAEAEAKELRAEIEKEEAEVAAGREKVNALEADFESVMNRKQKISDAVVEKTVEKSAVEKDISVLEEKIAALKLDRTQYENSIALRDSETGDIERKNTQLEEEIAVKTTEMEQASKKVEELGAAIQTLLAEKQEFEEKSRDLQGKAKDLRETVYSLTGEYNRIETKKVKLDVELENTINRLWDEYELTHSEALAYRRDVGPSAEVNKKIAGLRSKIRELGNVNVDAIEEYKSVSERYEFLSGQKNDLVKAKEDLNSIIAEMLTVMRKQFEEQFRKISGYFKTTFVELFGGGSASLTLEDPDNILECGISIDVQPPGKKLQSLSLLSGGERALSAIALLFAILKTRPTPFCFLDEIEAALDDVNVYRFADYVKNYSKETQFIIVTHRRGTMECADVIYGVTMQEKGVSKLLELNINEIAG